MFRDFQFSCQRVPLVFEHGEFRVAQVLFRSQPRVFDGIVLGLHRLPLQIRGQVQDVLLLQIPQLGYEPLLDCLLGLSRVKLRFVFLLYQNVALPLLLCQLRSQKFVVVERVLKLLGKLLVVWKGRGRENKMMQTAALVIEFLFLFLQEERKEKDATIDNLLLHLAAKHEQKTS